PPITPINRKTFDDARHNRRSHDESLTNAVGGWPGCATTSILRRSNRLCHCRTARRQRLWPASGRIADGLVLGFRIELGTDQHHDDRKWSDLRYVFVTGSSLGSHARDLITNDLDSSARHQAGDTVEVLCDGARI